MYDNVNQNVLMFIVLLLNNNALSSLARLLRDCSSVIKVDLMVSFPTGSLVIYLIICLIRGIGYFKLHQSAILKSFIQCTYINDPYRYIGIVAFYL